MRLAPVVVLLLVVALGALAPLAFASPPDPLWIGGVFDGGDSDDVVVAATSTEAAADGVPLRGVEIVLVAGAAVAPADSSAAIRPLFPVRPGRAPPAA
jgi:hypothetical protein